LQFLPYQAIPHGLISLSENQSVIRSNEEHVRRSLFVLLLQNV